MDWDTLLERQQSKGQKKKKSVLFWKYTLSFYTCQTKGGEKPRWVVSWDRSSKSHPQPFPWLGTHAAAGWVPGLGTHFTTIHHFPPFYAGTDSLLHDEGKYSPKSSVIPRLPLSAIRQALVMCRPLLCRGAKLFSQQTLQTPCELWLGESGQNQGNRHKFHLEVVESKIYLKWVIWGADSSWVASRLLYVIQPVQSIKNRGLFGFYKMDPMGAMTVTSTGA